MFSNYFVVLLTLVVTVDRLVDSHSFSDIVVFGDDNCDTGNTFNRTNGRYPSSPPYYFGRSSNGPLWIDRLSFRTRLNFALNGATITNDDISEDFFRFDQILIEDVRQQIVEYLKQNDLTTVDLSRTIFVVWAGANDFLTNPNLTASDAVTKLMNVISDLLVAQISSIIVMNQPALELYPLIRKSNRSVDLATRIIDFNRFLLSNISSIDKFYEKVSIRIFDLYTLINSLLLKKTNEQIITSDPCWSLENSTFLISSCSNPDQYLFIDDSHFTSSIHRFIAQEFQQFLNSKSQRIFSLNNIFVFLSFFLLLSNLPD